MMGRWLARLKNEISPGTHAREPRQPPEQAGGEGFLGLLAYPPAPFQKHGDEAAANDTAAATDPDRFCWPHSPAMNGAEIDTFTARLARFSDKGVSFEDAERLADMLVTRDRDGEDRRLCLECVHLQGAGRWRCSSWTLADVARDGLAADLVSMLQRCSAFDEVRL